MRPRIVPFALWIDRQANRLWSFWCRWMLPLSALLLFLDVLVSWGLGLPCTGSNVCLALIVMAAIWLRFADGDL